MGEIDEMDELDVDDVDAAKNGVNKKLKKGKDVEVAKKRKIVGETKLTFLEKLKKFGSRAIQDRDKEIVQEAEEKKKKLSEEMKAEDVSDEESHIKNQRMLELESLDIGLKCASCKKKLNPKYTLSSRTSGTNLVCFGVCTCKLPVENLENEKFSNTITFVTLAERVNLLGKVINNEILEE